MFESQDKKGDLLLSKAQRLTLWKVHLIDFFFFTNRAKYSVSRCGQRYPKAWALHLVNHLSWEWLEPVTYTQGNIMTVPGQGTRDFVTRYEIFKLH